MGAGWMPNRGNMGMMGAPNMGGWGHREIWVARETWELREIWEARETWGNREIWEAEGTCDRRGTWAANGGLVDSIKEECNPTHSHKAGAKGVDGDDNFNIKI